MAFAPAVPPDPAPPPPPAPAFAVELVSSKPLCVALWVSSNVRLELAAPAAPAVPPELVPPDPPLAVCPRMRVASLVEPVTALTSVLAAPFPPLAPL